MGTCIEAVATATKRGRVIGRGARRLTDVAAATCLERAHHDATDVDLLINAGLYKDFHTAEPALASIIQDDLDANPTLRPGHHGTFSFDLLNGGCGFVTAAQLADGFVGHGGASLALIVAADVDPSPRTSRGFPFAPAGGAVLLGRGPDGLGFDRFALRTFVEDASLFESYLRWDKHAGLTRRGRNVLEVREAPEFATRCIDRAAAVTTEFFAAAELTTRDIDLVIASQYPAGFAAGFMRRLRIPSNRAPTVGPELCASHTAGPIAALEAAVTSGRFANAQHTLFVTVGAGITVGLALYRGRT